VSQRSDDLNYLRLLSIFYFVVAGLGGLCACFPVFHIVWGVGLVTGAFDMVETRGQPPPPPFFGWMMIVFGGAAILFGWVFALGMALAGWFLRERKGYLFCLIMAGLATLFSPHGTILGIFTFIVLFRPGVKQLFNQDEQVAVTVLPTDGRPGPS
jgi:hypothetical protein